MFGRILLAVSLFTVEGSAQERLLEPGDLPGRAAAGAAIVELLEGRTDLATTVALAAFAGRQLPGGSAARAKLDAALQTANRSAADDATLARLRMALGELGEALTFEPMQQAELPAGFPGFRGVDEVELRHYPAYRMVRTSMEKGSTSAFWPLFRHIEGNDIAMTTPVQVDWQATGDGAERPSRMAFLYGRPDMETKQVGDRVEVVEAKAALVLSIGTIGDDRRDRVEALHQRLLAFVAHAKGAWVAAGPLRTMGYNSPMVPRDRRYFEVQLPVRRSDATGQAVVR